MDPAIAARLTAVRRLGLLDTGPETSFDSLVSLASQIFAAPISVFSILDSDRQWFKAKVGLTVSETPLDIYFCTHALASGEAVFETPDTTLDPRFDHNPLVWGEMGLRYYAGAVIRCPTGAAIGTLCVLDTAPRAPMSALARGQLRSLADAVEDALRLRTELALRKETEAQLARSEASYRMLADHCHDILLRTDHTGKISYASPSTRMIGYDPDEVIGLSLADFVPPDHRSAVLAGLATLFDPTAPDFDPASPDEVMQKPYPALTKTGETRWLEGASRVVRDAAGHPSELVSLYRDVTVQRALQARLEAAVEAKAAFLANMSHELRTPLTSILGFTALLQQTLLPAAAAGHVRRIATAGDALLALINDVLDVSKLEAGQIELELEPTEIAALVEEVRDILSVQALVKGVRLQIINDLNHPCRKVDGLRLRQVLLNLAGNAVKFTDHGAVRIHLQSAGPAGENLRIEVIDSGPGIPEAHRKKLFRRFAQGDSSVTRRHGGTGLGLAICRELIELMGGQIGADARDQPGACFWLEIPAAPAVPIPTSAAEDVAPSGPAPSIAGRVLIVDDHPVNRELVRLFLASPDVTTAEAENGRTAVERATVERFDLILMDVNMPVMDGLAAAAAIRSGCPMNADTPIVALTAQTGSEIEEKCFDAGMDGVLSKPISHADLLALATQILTPQVPLQVKIA
ncbi:ATP-binding protein [Phenylobacterium sp.]|uniref:ATP-binding protein n=1 Tax=Phenylobacterium sp. TaxID=1871053 RepID=UPI002730C91D|nr:ATP-binding protein [Phenylobacterium sp.]MDP2212458.1 ATP-binding protein [Phenylobacterium sp.]